MGFTVASIVHQGYDYTDTYHRLVYGDTDPLRARTVVGVRVYASKAVHDANRENFMHHLSLRRIIRVTEADYNTHFTARFYADSQSGTVRHPLAYAYDFVESQVGGGVDGNTYQSFPYNYITATRDNEY